MTCAIRVNGLSKKYRLGARSVSYDTLRDRLALSFRSPFRAQARRNGHSQNKWVWALRDVSFEVRPGEVVGVIGRNGAGKSTLLKILSRITEPTSGRVELYGRVGSLLEVGTGFHPELTGSENVYLNGAILGMTRKEIARKFDEIVSFAEVEEFLDTPVKHYSTGMYMRLAFAVAAHLDPEILIVDEVLAVGDAAFQRKCLAKMGTAAFQGKTVLFVSHNLAAVRSLCTRAILIESGNVEIDSDVETCIAKYMSDPATTDAVKQWEPTEGAHSAAIRFTKAYVMNHRDEPTSRVDHRQEFTIAIEYEVLKPVRNLRIGFLLQNIDGTPICGSNDPHAWPSADRTPGKYISKCSFPARVLNAGTYVLGVGSDNPPMMDALVQARPCLRFEVEVAEEAGLNRVLPGVIRPSLKWQVEKN